MVLHLARLSQKESLGYLPSAEYEQLHGLLKNDLARWSERVTKTGSPPTRSGSPGRFRSCSASREAVRGATEAQFGLMLAGSAQVAAAAGAGRRRVDTVVPLALVSTFG